MYQDRINNLLFEIMRKILYYRPLTKETFEMGIDVPLTESYWNFDAVQLVYLFCEVEKVYHIHIPVKNLMSYRFITIRRISNQVVNLLPASNL